MKRKEMLDSGCSILEVANALKVHRFVVYRKLERGGNVIKKYRNRYLKNVHESGTLNWKESGILWIET